MAGRFNSLLTPRSGDRQYDATNAAGAPAYALDAKTRLALLAVASHLKDDCYRSANEQLKEIQFLCDELDPLYVAKLAVYARRVIGNRTISHVLAGEVFMDIKSSGQKWLTQFAKAIVRRPDDMGEILSYLKARGFKKLPCALKRGFAKALEGMNPYSLAKYRGEGKEYNLYDVVNLCHPKASPALTALMRGSLATPRTWETVISAAGSDPARKAAAWSTLLFEKELGYLALLRNVRNICEAIGDSESAMDDLCKQLEAVQTDKVFPHQFLPFLDAGLENIPARVVKSIEIALDKTLDSIPEIQGSTLIAVDASGSMFHDNASHIKKAAMFAAALERKSRNAVVVLFDQVAGAFTVRGAASVLEATNALLKKAQEFKRGTDFSVIFNGLSAHFDNIVILSDMQGWINGQNLKESFADYRRAVHSNPNVLCFDTAAYGTVAFPQEKIYLLGGVSEKVFNIAATLFSDKKALVESIERADFNLA